MIAAWPLSAGIPTYWLRAFLAEWQRKGPSKEPSAKNAFDLISDCLN
jgi:hypothetical protein